MNLDFGFLNWADRPELHPQGPRLLGPAHADRDDRRHRPRHGPRADAPVRQALAGDAGGGLRQHAALDPAGDGDPVVLPADPAAARPAARRRAVGDDHLHRLRGGLLLGDHARRHPVGAEGAGRRRLCGRHDLRAVHEADRPAAGVPQHAAGAADADDHPVPGHLARLRDRRLRPAARASRSPARTSTARSRPTWSPRSSTSSSASACRCSCASCRRRSPSSAEPRHRDLP